MKLQSLSIPESTQEIPKWLEQQIMSPEFHEFVAQLQISRDSEGGSKVAVDSPETLSGILGDAQPDVIQNGFANCSAKQISQLLANPKTLLDLHSEVYEAGSDYWMNQISPSTPAVLEALKTKVKNAPDAAGLTDSNKATGTTVGTTGKSSSQTNRRGFGLAMLTLAAGIAIVASVYSNLGGIDGGPKLARWGWLAEDAIPKNVSPGEYLAALADGGADWNSQDLSTSDKYIERLKDMQTGCSMLIKAEHAPLAAVDKAWLVEKCKAWQVKFDEQLAAANSDPQRFEDHLKQTNQTVESLVKALKERAQSV